MTRILSTGTPRVLILGIGNLLWADEGFGVRAIQYLERHYRFPDQVRILDGGTQGIYLVQEVREAEVLVVLDAVDYGLPPGTLKRVEGEDVPKFLGVRKISLHQTGFQEVLAMAAMLGDYPDHLLLVGVQPVELEDYGGSLRPEVKAQIPAAIDEVLAWLSRFGIQAERREEPLAPATVDALSDMRRYEAERPPEEVACRKGDPRVLLAAGGRLRYREPDRAGLSVRLDQHLDAYRSETD